MAKLVIDTEDLILALETNMSEMTYFIDIETGEILWASEYEEYNSGVSYKKMEKKPKKYFRIEPVPSREGFKIMEEFVEALPDDVTKIRLEDAIYGKKPFRNFKDKLNYFPEIRKEWFKYQSKRMCEYCKIWLKDNSIEAELTPLREQND